MEEMISRKAKYYVKVKLKSCSVGWKKTVLSCNVSCSCFLTDAYSAHLRRVEALYGGQKRVTGFNLLHGGSATTNKSVSLEWSTRTITVCRYRPDIAAIIHRGGEFCDGISIRWMNAVATERTQKHCFAWQWPEAELFSIIPFRTDACPRIAAIKCAASRWCQRGQRWRKTLLW